MPSQRAAAWHYGCRTPWRGPLDDLEPALATWIELLGDLGPPVPAFVQVSVPGPSHPETHEVSSWQSLWVDERGADGAWRSVERPQRLLLKVQAWLDPTGQLDARRMHPVVFSADLYDDAFVPVLPDVEPGLRNQLRLGQFLGRSELQLGLELFGIEAPRFPKQACAWGFLEPHSLGRPC